MKKDLSKEKKYLIVTAWKKAYTDVLIDMLHPFGNVLEVGFGPGYAAQRIQTYNPKSHTIIEPNPQYAKDAISWANKSPAISIIQDTWQNALPNLELFDTIFLNDYSPASEMELMHYLYPEETTTYNSQTKDLLNTLEEQFSQVKVHYSNEEIDEFYKKIGQFQKAELSQFFSKLKTNGNISAEQYETTLKKYQIPKEELKAPVNFVSDTDRMFTFLKECTKSHMHKGSRFSCFSSDPTSKYDNPQFFEHIITSSDFDYQEELVPVEVSLSQENKSGIALVMVIEKTS